MEQLTNSVAEHIMSQIKDKLLPVISEKYNIPMSELVSLVNNKVERNKKIVATPKSTSSHISDLQEKIATAQAQNKVFNISTARPLADMPSNRKKYKFFDELGIAGLVDDSKLTDALKLLGAPSKKEIPVHVLASKAETCTRRL